MARFRTRNTALTLGRLALVLVVAAGLDALGLNMFAVKHQDMGFLVV